MLHTHPSGRIGGPLGSRVRGVMQCRTAMSMAEPVVCGRGRGSLRGTRSRRLNYCLLALAVGVYVYCALTEAGVGMVFIVQGKPREPEGIVKVIRQTRKEALETANDFLNEGFPFVSIVGDGRVYTVKEFATTVGNDEPE
jgi:hypothetical protein